MRQQRLIGIAALVLMVAGLVLVAADGLLFPGVKHEPGNCPICALAQCLAATQLPPPVLAIAPLDHHGLPPATTHVFWSEAFSQAFSARAPPSCIPV